MPTLDDIATGLVAILYTERLEMEEYKQYIFDALRATERAAYERAADEIENIGKKQPDARDDAFLLGISFVIRALATVPGPAQAE